MSDQGRCTIIAICGIDGSGKSTIIDRLRAEPMLRDACFIKKQDKENINRVIDLNTPIGPMPQAYLKGPLAASIRWAHAFDYLRFYETTVRPLTRRHSILVSDRWSFCPIAFANVGTRLAEDIDFLLRHVGRPDLTIFLDVDAETAFARLQARGPVLDDEHIDLLRAYREAYENYFASYSGPLERIRSTGKDQAYHDARSAIEGRLGRLPCAMSISAK
jgi:dTMP kinase